MIEMGSEIRTREDTGDVYVVNQFFEVNGSVLATRVRDDMQFWVPSTSIISITPPSNPPDTADYLGYYEAITE